MGLQMAAGSSKEEEETEVDPEGKAMSIAAYPLAVPYLLTLAGIAVLIIASDGIDSLLIGAVIIGVVLLVGLIDMLIFRNVDVLAKYLAPSRMIVTEVVFGVLFAAIAIRLFFEGLNDLGIVVLEALH